MDELLVIEDSCDALGSSRRGAATGTRSNISVTPFALSHVITATGTGGLDYIWTTAEAALL
jgi:CDP-6-deoxy-D-xylo-4-hexulose-3-dehydrase